MKVENMLSACRVCLQDGNDSDMKSIFSRDEREILISIKIEECGGIKIIDDSSLPANICKKCYDILGISYKFRTICKNSDNYLQVFVRKDCKTNTESITKEENVVAVEEYPESAEESYEDYESMGGDGTCFEEYTNDNLLTDTQIKFDAEEQIINQQIIVSQISTQENHNSDNEIVKDFFVTDLGYNVVISEFASTEAAQRSNRLFNKKQIDVDQRLIESSPTKSTASSYVMKRKPGRPRKRNNVKSFIYDGINGSNKEPIKSKLKTSSNYENSNEKLIYNPEDINVNSINKHICEICGNTYERKYCLEAHMRRHRGEKPFECEICKKSFALNFQLTRHMRSHTGQRPYKCKYCDRTFSDRSTNVKHERIHTNERPYKCDTCGKSFTYSNVLKVHKMIHTGEKPYVCELCSKGFSQLHHLRAHLQIQLHKNDPRVKDLLLKTDAEVIKKFYDTNTKTKQEYSDGNVSSN